MIIGLTGGIASGKSLIANEFEKRGFPVIDADKISREIVRPGEEAYEQIVEQFGAAVLQPDGMLARKKLGQVIFSDAAKREMLNNIMHPIIRKRMLEKKDHYEKEGFHTIIFDIPLLIENKLRFMVDKVLLIYVDEKTQKKRLIARDGQGEQDAASRIASQMPLMEKKAHADGVIDNNGSVAESIKQLEAILDKWGVNTLNR
ncbi:dephospho-CoA kinase [Bacillus piscicola]|uniref:dephospho-CoA kinase n=1 Tax=Bacillus piscicola TaxID=1632684 RepID=UPI001F08A5E1|nr:dephospho-CoA kinase [Bacillus piscicola]